ncbi:MAG: glycosyltransferase family 4 protein [Rhodobacterales bacterium]
MPIHILLTVNAAWNIWNFRRPVVQALLKDGHRITVLAPPDDSVADLQRMGCRFLPLEMSAKGLNPLEGVKLYSRFKDVFRAEQPDIVLSYTIKNNIFGAMAAKSTGVPFVPNVTGLGTAFLSGGLLQIVAEGLYRCAFAKLPTVFFQNEDDRSLFISRRLIKGYQTRLLPGSGIDLEHFAPLPSPSGHRAPVFLMISRLLRDKGVLEFVKAARLVKAHMPEVRFQLLGALNAENRSAIDAATLQAWVDAGHVEYLGTTDDVRPYITRATCVVLPSYREGAPRTLIEAAAMARPTITTDVPGCRSVIEAGVTGLLCKPKDAGSLAKACERFLLLPPAAKTAMGAAGRRRMEELYDQSIIVAQYRAAITEALTSSNPKLTAYS